MPTRYQALMALWLFQIVNYLDRTSISFAGPTMMKSMGLDAQDFGVVLSSFALGYFLAQIPGGLIADRWGVRIVCIVTPLLWAFCTGAVGLVSSIGGLVAARVCLGLSEGLSNSAIFKLVGDLFPSRDRARAAGYWATSFAVAPALGGPLIALLLVSFDWRVTFALLALPALGAALINWYMVPAGAATARFAAPRPADAMPAESGHTGFAALLRSRAMWIIAAAYMFFNVGYYGFNGWMPSYLAAAHGIDLKKVGLIGGIPYVFAIAGLLVLGWLAGARLYAMRVQLWAASYVLSAVFMFLAYRAETLTGSLAGLSGAAFFLFGSLGLFAAVVIDYAPAEARASFSALTTTAGQFGGIVAPLIIGYLVKQTGSYAGGFGFMIVSLLIAAVATLGLLTLRSGSPALPGDAYPAA